VHGSNGASVGVQTDGGQMFISGMTTKVEAAFNDLWTIPGEATRLAEWKAEDETFFGGVDAMTYFHHREIEQFLQAITSGLPAPVPAEAGLRVARIIEGIYRSNKEGRSVVYQT
jgi:predicted dehydrogenase